MEGLLRIAFKGSP
uniref:Uncharacterized protein n=1 Tax=Anguilla anguilla TaxID=7936 RepID=A0A0E9V934_ANGAN